MQSDPLLSFFKLFADVARLQIAGLLATEALTVEALAARVGLAPAEVSKRLAPLRQAGLVVEGQRPGEYRLDRRAWERMARETLRDHRARPDLSDPTAAYFTLEGRVRSLPTDADRRRLLLERLAERVEPARDYSERELNALLGALYDDYALLRRELVDAGLLLRTVAVGQPATYRRPGSA